jgi:hypothetical protein
VIWTTGVSAPAYLYLGTSKHSLTRKIHGTESRYKYLDYTSGYIKKVNVTGLMPSTTYYFKLTRGITTYIGNFTTVPAVGSPITLTLVADVGTSIYSIETMQNQQKTGGQAILMIGDFSYADSFQPRWDVFQRLWEQFVGTKPLFYCQGNHELEQAWPYGNGGTYAFTEFGGINGFLPTSSRYASTMAASSAVFAPGGVEKELFTSTNLGMAHIIALNSYFTYSKYTVQWAWIQYDLGAVNRAVTPWSIAIMHAPWYISTYSHFLEGETMRAIFEPFVRKFGVDIVFHGHVHVYERFTNVYDYRADPCGPAYISIGNGGNHEGASSWSGPGFQPNATNAESPVLFNIAGGAEPAISAFREYTYGHGTLTIYNATSALWQYFRNEDNATFAADSTWLSSHASTYKACQALAAYPLGTYPKYSLPNADGTTNSWYPIA